MKLSLAPLKYVIGCWTHLGTTLVYLKKKYKSDHGIQGPQEAYFQAYIIYYYGPKGFEVGEAKEFLSLQMSRDHGKKKHTGFLPINFLFVFSAQRFQSYKKRREDEGGKAKHE